MSGKSVEQRRHVVIILDAVHTDPGKDVGTGDVILVIGLVHVPDEGYGERMVGHGWHKWNGER